jgi:hypothetical protein
LNHDPGYVFSEKRFLDRLFSRCSLEKHQKQDLADIKYFTMLHYKTDEPTVEQIRNEIKLLREIKLDQSVEIKIHPDDTPAQIMLRFAEEFLYILITQKKEDNYSYVPLSTKIDNSPELMDAIFQNDKNKAKDYFNKNPDFFDGITKKLASYEPFAKRFLDDAWDNVFDNNYKNALNLINEGIQFNDKTYNPHLYELKSTCLLGINQPAKALDSINQAIDLLIQDPFDFDENIGTFLRKRSSIKKELKDSEGSKNDEEIANKYKILWDANYQDKLTAPI